MDRGGGGARDAGRAGEVACRSSTGARAKLAEAKEAHAARRRAAGEPRGGDDDAAHRQGRAPDGVHGGGGGAGGRGDPRQRTRSRPPPSATPTPPSSRASPRRRSPRSTSSSCARRAPPRASGAPFAVLDAAATKLRAAEEAQLAREIASARLERFAQAPPERVDQAALRAARLEAEPRACRARPREGGRGARGGARAAAQGRGDGVGARVAAPRAPTSADMDTLRDLLPHAAAAGVAPDVVEMATAALTEAEQAVYEGGGDAYEAHAIKRKAATVRTPSARPRRPPTPRSPPRRRRPPPSPPPTGRPRRRPRPRTARRRTRARRRSPAADAEVDGVVDALQRDFAGVAASRSTRPPRLAHDGAQHGEVLWAAGACAARWASAYAEAQRLRGLEIEARLAEAEARYEADRRGREAPRGVQDRGGRRRVQQARRRRAT